MTLTAPAPLRPDLSALLQQAVSAFNAMSREHQHEMMMAQRKSWVVGEMMLQHPEMSRAEVEAIYDRVVF